MIKDQERSDEYEAGLAEGWRLAIEALRDRATVNHMAFADAALYLESLAAAPSATTEEPSRG